jgi:hypothetical protein
VVARAGEGRERVRVPRRRRRRRRRIRRGAVFLTHSLSLDCQIERSISSEVTTNETTGQLQARELEKESC